MGNQRSMTRSARHIRRALQKAMRILRGFSPRGSSYWAYLEQSDEFEFSNMSSRELRRIHRKGFSVEDFTQIGDCGRDHLRGLSDYWYLYLYPLQGKFNRLVNDPLTVRYVFDRYGDLFPKYYYSLIKKEGTTVYVPLQDAPACEGCDCDAIEKLLREGANLIVKSPKGDPSLSEGASRGISLSYEKGTFFQEGVPSSRSEITAVLEGMPARSIVLEDMDKSHSLGEAGALQARAVQFVVCNLDGVSPEIVQVYTVLDDHTSRSQIRTIDKTTGIISGSTSVSEQHGSHLEYEAVPLWDDLVSAVLSASSYVPELEYLGFKVVVCERSFKVVEISACPQLFWGKTDDDDLWRYLDSALDAKRKRGGFLQSARQVLRKCSDLWILDKTGFMGYMYRSWKRDLRIDSQSSTLHRKEINWAHDKGFFSYRIKQYGLTDDNYSEFLSDREYRWLRPINCEYRKWVYDKVSFRYVLDRYREFLPKYYFHIMTRSQGMVCAPMMDCPLEDRGGFDSVLSLLRKKGVLVAKPTEGSRGIGFCKLEYSEHGSYLLNNEAKSADEMLSILHGFDENYIITEYIEPHDFLKKLSPHAVSTIRITVVNTRVSDPCILDAYARIATNKTGLTDNVSNGGIFARVDIESGRLHSGEQSSNHNVTPCVRHPDSGVGIDGFIPHWDEVKQTVQDICVYIAQLEYLGFDVAITNDAFKILEINTHQDLHRYPNYDPRLKEYFRRKIEYKKAKR